MQAVHEVPKGIRRLRVVTINEGKPGETMFRCRACTAQNPMSFNLPVAAIYKREDGIVLVNKDKCIGCGYCLYACPFGAPQFPDTGLFGSKGKMDKCTFCIEPFEQKDEKGNLIQRDAKPRCAAFCGTKGLLAGDIDAITEVYKKRVAGKLPAGASPDVA